jgi:hypothetical protein
VGRRRKVRADIAVLNKTHASTSIVFLLTRLHMSACLLVGQLPRIAVGVWRQQSLRIYNQRLPDIL